ncbi:MAG TPA: glycosyltransferase family 4 protein [Saprospiraceae bacterium]|nr:glycosyltransferase family 4 protein [Saprospiraceae bacterium]
MNLGFYYHITITKKEGKLYLPGYLAVFINALANEVNNLTLFLHEADKTEAINCDTELSGNNISWVNLGIKSPAWHRSIFHKQLLKPINEHIENLDILLIRGPSPLAPYFRLHISNKQKTAYLVVGDYKEGMQDFKINSIRDVLVKWYTVSNDQKFKKAMNGGLVIVNSEKLFTQFVGDYKHLYLIKTTTLSDDDFYNRSDSFVENKNIINLLYTGRIVREKGIDNILKACLILQQEGVPIELHIAGMLDAKHKNYIEELINISEYNGKKILHYHGFKKVGHELNQLYRDAQIYIIASLSDFEGFPRTIWEAMANSCPVIASSVGGIPHYLKDEHHALLIPPKDVVAIVEAVKRIITNQAFRQKLIRNGYALAQTNTLEVQSKFLVQILKNHIDFH